MASKAKVKLLAEMAIDAEVDLGMTGSAYPLEARLYVRPAWNDPKADAYLAANCLLLWRRRMTNVLLSPYMAHGPAGTSRNSRNFQSHNRDAGRVFPKMGN